MKFIDYVEIEITAGDGGHGCVSFHTEKFVPKGGPDGGDGGRGGDITAVADSNLTTLLDYRYRSKYFAQKGNGGSGRLKTGRSGEETTLRLPAGTLITDLGSGQIVADLNESGDQITIARGGKGGHGNAYYKSAVNQSPRKAQDGQKGEYRKLALELKLLADVGLVGLPNAGKSTILASLSAARPKIADYPFTTLTPNLGIVKLREFKSCVMADIPGLIEGAAEGKGLGHQFLRHIQRTGLIVYVIDINEEKIEETLSVLENELSEFDTALGKRSSLVVITKIDTVSESDLKTISSKLSPDYIYISAVSHMGTENFIREIEKRLDRQRT